MKNIILIAVFSFLILAGCATSTSTGTKPTPAASPSNSTPVSSSSPVVEKVDFTKVKAVIEQRCQVCHSSNPKDPSFGSPPAGVAFDTVDQIKAKADRINQRAVIEKSMPKLNKTMITQEERDLLGKWVAAGAPVQ